jgi:acetyl esterase/lipase
VTAVDPREVLSRSAAGPDIVLRYGDEPDHLVDVHLPATKPGASPAPLVVLIHGGFWHQEYDRRQIRPMAEGLAKLGFAVASLEYRRVDGAGGWPTTLDDVAAGLDALPKMLTEVAPGRVDVADSVLVGHSAGGHLAMWAAANTAGWLRRVVALAPVADLREAHRRRLGGSAVADLLGGSPDRVPERYDFADAATDSPDRLPTVVIHGQEDEQVPVEMSRALCGVDLVELPDVEHFGLIDPLSAAWPSVVAALRPPTPQAADPAAR